MNEVILRNLIRKQINEIMDSAGPRMDSWDSGWRSGWSDALQTLSDNADKISNCPADIKRLIYKLRKDGQLSRR